MNILALLDIILLNPLDLLAFNTYTYPIYGMLIAASGILMYKSFFQGGSTEV